MSQIISQKEILKMQSGIDMDALVAVKIMGIDVKHDWHWKHTTKNYSDDISAAFEVAEKIGGLHLMEFTAINHKWRAAFKENIAEAETAPLAICRAALLAVVPVDIGGV